LVRAINFSAFARGSKPAHAQPEWIMSRSSKRNRFLASPHSESKEPG